MQQIGIWQVTREGPRKIDRGTIDLERYLEDWIERNPTLLQSGLTIVGRQIGVEGGMIDLLALDPAGRWVVIEIKRGNVRRDTIAQAVDYASCIAAMPHTELSQKVEAYLGTRGPSVDSLLEERGLDDITKDEGRDVVMFVVGTGRDPGLERIVDFLSTRFEVPINVVSYEVFEIADGQQILVRELTEAEFKPPNGPAPTAEDICAIADQTGVGTDFRKILAVAQKHGVFARPYKTSVMYTPPTNRARTLFTVWARARADGLLRAYVATDAFAEFYPVTEEEAASVLGPAGWRQMAPSDVDLFITGLDRLFESIEQTE